MIPKTGDKAIVAPGPGEEFADRRKVIGIDLGGTKILAGLADCSGKILVTHEEATKHGADAPVLDQIGSIVLRLFEIAGLPVSDLHEVAIGIPSAVNPVTGFASLSPNLALPENCSLAELLESRVSCRVTIENDVNLAAYAEAVAGAGKGLGSLAFISFGTGVGLGLVLGGDLWRGEHGRAGEIAYLPMGAAPHATAPDSENGLYEDEVGSRGIRSRFTGEGNTVADLFTAARSGDSNALAALDEVARSASTGIAAVHALVDPAITVVGGGIGSQGEFLPLLEKYLAPLLPFRCRLEHSHFGARAGLIGAVLLAARKLQEMPVHPDNLRCIPDAPVHGQGPR